MDATTASDDLDSLDYSYSNSQEIWQLPVQLKVRDEKYFTEGFIDVGELPRMY